MRPAIVIAIVASLLLGAPAPALAQDAAATWRTFAAQMEVGAAIKVRLRDGRRFRATLVAARPDALMLQRRTRLAVPVEPVAYDAIVSIEREKGGVITAGKAAAIGVAAGAGAFLAILVLLVASLDD